MYNLNLINSTSNQINLYLGKFDQSEAFNYNNAFTGNITQLMVTTQNCMKRWNYIDISTPNTVNIIPTHLFNFNLTSCNGAVAIIGSNYSLPSFHTILRCNH